ncbi:hypothetical protein LINGRAHAP2_LOCUS11143 [Linum grandiflorum]
MFSLILLDFWIKI